MGRLASVPGGLGLLDHPVEVRDLLVLGHLGNAVLDGVSGRVEDWIGPVLLLGLALGIGSGDSSSGWDETLRGIQFSSCLLYTSPSPRDGLLSRMPSSA